MSIFTGSSVALDPFAELNRWRAQIEKEGLMSITPPPSVPAPSVATITSVAVHAASVFKITGIDPLRLLSDRLRLPSGKLTFKGIDCVHIYAAADKVVVMYYKDGAANILEEEASLFPSDSLVAQFHLLMG